MAISKDNIQVYTTLHKNIVEKLDKGAKDNSRTRSKEIAHIIKKHYERKDV